MPLDPKVRDFLSRLPTLNPPTSVEELRRNWNSAFSGKKVEIEKVIDLEIPTRDDRIRARLYLPKRTDSMIVFYHGGGFVFGDVESYDGLSRLIAKESEIPVISIGYRLAPEHKFPTAVNDAWDSLVWIAKEMGISKVAVMGDSAGGNLAAVVSQMDRDNKTKLVKFQVLLYPAVNMVDNSPSVHEFAEGYFLTRKLMSWFGSLYFSSGREAVNPLASPALGKLNDLPPSLVITAEYDPLRDQGETYSQALKEAGNESVCVRYKGMIHGFISFYDWFKAGRVAINQVASTLKEELS
ncbi:MAG: alpha/beta hydrolase [Metallosphaera sp.]